MPDSYQDAIVVGGGPAGSVAALILARSGWQVTLIERGEGAAFRVGESLPPAARPLLRDLGLAHLLDAGHLPAYGNLSAWGSAELARTDFIRDPHGHGWHLDRTRFDADLRAAARANGVTVVEGLRVRAAARAQDVWTVDCWPHPALYARWLIDCSGRAAVIARTQQQRPIASDRLVALVTRWQVSDPDPDPDPDRLTLVEAVREGWWYTAALPNRERIVAFQTDAGSVAARNARSPAGYTTLLAQTEHLRDRLAPLEYRPIGVPQLLSARSMRLVQPVGAGWIAAGDAALAFDPLSSQGILTALYTGMRAAEAVVATHHGDRVALAHYAARIDAIAATYHQQLRQYYAIEQRWHDAPFWRKRQIANTISYGLLKADGQ